MNRNRFLLVPVLAVVAFVGVAPPAGAHVSIPDEVEAGGFASVTLVVPNERDDSSTVSLEVQIPRDHVLPLVSVQMKPGWEAEVTMRTLDEPVELFGREVTEVVDTIVWTGGTIDPDRFDTFTLRAGPMPEEGGELVFPAVQVYDSGEEVAWIETEAPGGEEPEHPAPVLTVTSPATEPSSDSAEPDATTDSETEEDAAGAVTDDDDDDTDPLALAAAVIAVLAAALGVGAIAMARRSGADRAV